MSDADETLVVAMLRSNAAALVAGAPVAAFRRKLKLASVIYDHVALETGFARIQAGPGGSSSWWHPPDPDGPEPRFQSSAGRNQAVGKPFTAMIGVENGPGVPAANLVPLVATDTTYYWEATLDPFRKELPASCDWIHYVGAPEPPPSLVDESKRWTRLDKANGVLSGEFPDAFVRNRIIEDTNKDLAVVAGSGGSFMADRVHAEVLNSRLSQGSGWQLNGFALPVLLPNVGDLSWEAIAEIRKDRGLQQLRRTWRQIELDALTTTESGGDLERAVHTSYAKQLRDAARKGDGLKAFSVNQGTGLLLNGAGAAIGALFGPAGAVAGFVAPTVVGGAIDARRILGRRAAVRWLALDTRLQNL